MIRSFPPHPNPLPPGERVGHSSPQQTWGVFWHILINPTASCVLDKWVGIAVSKLKEAEEMGQNLVQKIVKTRLASGSIEPGKRISLSVDQTLMHDATGQMAALEF